MSIAELPKIDAGIILRRVPWLTYVELRDAPENNHLRMTFDRGDLKIMSPSWQHERIARLLGSLIDIWTMEFRIPKQSCGSLTIRRKDIELGFEPDNCYYVQNRLHAFQRTKNLIFRKRPSALIWRSKLTRVVRRSPNYGDLRKSFRVPELWRIVNQEIRVFELTVQSDYKQRDTSLCFPGFPIERVNEILKQFSSEDETIFALFVPRLGSARTLLTQNR